MTTKYALFSAVPRSGNTFLSYCFNQAVELNRQDNLYIKTVPNLHAPVVLSFNNTEEARIYTIFRKPEDNIISSTAAKILIDNGSDHKIEDNPSLINLNIIRSIEQYVDYLDFQNRYQNANIIMFDKLISDPHYIISKILFDFNIPYINKISIDSVFNSINRSDDLIYRGGTGDFVDSLRHLPHDIEKTLLHKKVKDMLPNISIYKDLEFLYEETLKNARNLGNIVYE